MGNACVGERREGVFEPKKSAVRNSAAAVKIHVASKSQMSNRVESIGKWPQITEKHFWRNESRESQLYSAIKELLETRQKRLHLDVTGPQGIGKTILLSKVLTEAGSSNTFGVKCVIWISESNLRNGRDNGVTIEQIKKKIFEMLGKFNASKSFEETLPTSSVLALVDLGQLKRPSDLHKLQLNRSIRAIVISREQNPTYGWLQFIVPPIEPTVESSNAGFREMYQKFDIPVVGRLLNSIKLNENAQLLDSYNRHESDESFFAELLKLILQDNTSGLSDIFKIYRAADFVGYKEIDLLWKNDGGKTGEYLKKLDESGILIKYRQPEDRTGHLNKGKKAFKEKSSKSESTNYYMVDVSLYPLLWNSPDYFKGRGLIYSIVDNGFGIVLRNFVDTFDADTLNELLLENLGSAVDKLKSENRLFKENNIKAMVSGNKNEKVFFEGVIKLLEKLVVEHSESISPVLEANNAEDLLYFSCKFGCLNMAKWLISNKNADVNEHPRDKPTPLMSAGSLGNLDLLELLLSKGANVNMKVNGDTTALHSAAESGQYEAMEILLNNGADINATKYNSIYYTDYGEEDSVFLLAIRSGNVDCVNFLLAKLGNEITSSVAPLHIAVNHNHFDIVVCLLRFEFPPDVKNLKGRTPLMTAMLQGDEEIVKRLLTSGASPSAKDNYDETPTTIGILNGNTECVALLGNQDALRECQVIEAILWDDLTKVKNLITAEHQLVNSDVNGFTSPLCVAVELGSTEMVKYFLEKNASPNVSRRLELGRISTPLIQAIEKGEPAIVALLLSKGAEPNKPSSDSGAPIIHAVRKGNSEIVKLLLQHSASPNAVYEKERESALIIATRTGDVDIVRMLVEKGADVSIKTDVGQTAVDIAERRGFGEIMEILIDAEIKGDGK